jgi:murein DD-endopeptidase MepM/ murein hydrolase activator NlpD
VVADIGGGHFAVYAHLKLGSVRVKTGDRVRRGDVLGLLGNTGNTSHPHLHFHIVDGPSALASNGLPYVISGMATSGLATDLEPLFNGEPTPIDAKTAGPHPQRLPLNNHVATFE